MTCPECGGSTYVAESYEKIDSLWRKRICRQCGKQFITTEHLLHQRRKQPSRSSIDKFLDVALKRY